MVQFTTTVSGNSTHDKLFKIIQFRAVLSAVNVILL